MFKCDQCGLCCQNLAGIDLYQDLNDGTGTCLYFDRKTKLCTIYNQRPLKCRVDDAYDAYFKDKMTKQEYYQMNYGACKKLKD